MWYTLLPLKIKVVTKYIYSKEYHFLGYDFNLFLGLYLTTPSVAEIIQDRTVRCLVNEELESMSKDAVVAYFK
jgi:hypothetical protein